MESADITPIRGDLRAARKAPWLLCAAAANRELPGRTCGKIGPIEAALVSERRGPALTALHIGVEKWNPIKAGAQCRAFAGV